MSFCHKHAACSWSVVIIKCSWNQQRWLHSNHVCFWSAHTAQKPNAPETMTQEGPLIMTHQKKGSTSHVNTMTSLSLNFMKWCLHGQIWTKQHSPMFSNSRRLKAACHCELEGLWTEHPLSVHVKAENMSSQSVPIVLCSRLMAAASS